MLQSDFLFCADVMVGLGCYHDFVSDVMVGFGDDYEFISNVTVGICCYREELVMPT